VRHLVERAETVDDDELRAHEAERGVALRVERGPREVGRRDAEAGSTSGRPPGFIDTGFPTLVTIAPGRLHGMTPDMSFIRGVAAGD